MKVLATSDDCALWGALTRTVEKVDGTARRLCERRYVLALLSQSWAGGWALDMRVERAGQGDRLDQPRARFFAVVRVGSPAPATNDALLESAAGDPACKVSFSACRMARGS